MSIHNIPFSINLNYSKSAAMGFFSKGLKNQGCHLSSTSKFPDFSLKFYSFPYPLTDPKKNYFYSLL